MTAAAATLAATATTHGLVAYPLTAARLTVADGDSAAGTANVTVAGGRNLSPPANASPFCVDTTARIVCSDGRVVRARAALLAAASPYFRRRLGVSAAAATAVVVDAGSTTAAMDAVADGGFCRARRGRIAEPLDVVSRSPAAAVADAETRLPSVATATVAIGPRLVLGREQAGGHAAGDDTLRYSFGGGSSNGCGGGSERRCCCDRIRRRRMRSSCCRCLAVDFSSEVVAQLVEYACSGNGGLVPFDDEDVKRALELGAAARTFEMHGLAALVWRHLSANLRAVVESPQFVELDDRRLVELVEGLVFKSNDDVAVLAAGVGRWLEWDRLSRQTAFKVAITKLNARRMEQPSNGQGRRRPPLSMLASSNALSLKTDRLTLTPRKIAQSPDSVQDSPLGTKQDIIALNSPCRLEYTAGPRISRDYAAGQQLVDVSHDKILVLDKARSSSAYLPLLQSQQLEKRQQSLQYPESHGVVARAGDNLPFSRSTSSGDSLQHYRLQHAPHSAVSSASATKLEHLFVSAFDCVSCHNSSPAYPAAATAAGLTTIARRQQASSASLLERCVSAAGDTWSPRTGPFCCGGTRYVAAGRRVYAVNAGDVAGAQSSCGAQQLNVYELPWDAVLKENRRPDTALVLPLCWQSGLFLAGRQVGPDCVQLELRQTGQQQKQLWPSWQQHMQSSSSPIIPSHAMSSATSTGMFAGAAEGRLKPNRTLASWLVECVTLNGLYAIEYRTRTILRLRIEIVNSSRIFHPCKGSGGGGASCISSPSTLTDPARLWEPTGWRVPTASNGGGSGDTFTDVHNVFADADGALLVYGGDAHGRRRLAYADRVTAIPGDSSSSTSSGCISPTPYLDVEVPERVANAADVVHLAGTDVFFLLWSGHAEELHLRRPPVNQTAAQQYQLTRQGGRTLFLPIGCRLAGAVHPLCVGDGARGGLVVLVQDIWSSCRSLLRFNGRQWSVVAPVLVPLATVAAATSSIETAAAGEIKQSRLSGSGSGVVRAAGAGAGSDGDADRDQRYNGGSNLVATIGRPSEWSSISLE